jgi:beta-glucosidase/6-phospho-beta-glucosidase/beta-galactosidase
MEFRWGWMFDPVITGDYPAAMRAHFGSQLPAFTLEEQQLLKGSVDFLGVNIYTARYIAGRSENGMVSNTVLLANLLLKSQL